MYGTDAIRRYVPLLVVLAFSIAIKALDPIRSPVLGALDPWGWTALTRKFLATGDISSPLFTQSGYPPTFVYLVAAIASLLSRDPYDVIRYIPVATALNVIPIYLLAFIIFRSHTISASASLLTMTARYYFIRTSIGVPEGLAHFFLTFTLLFILLSITTNRWKYSVAGIGFMAAAILYYHFTLLILVPFILALPFTMRLTTKGASKILASIAVPALLLGGILWYFRVFAQMVRFLLPLRDYAHQPVTQPSLAGLIHLVAYSVGKSGAISLAYFGYAMTALALAGAAIMLRRRKKWGVGVTFLLTYLGTIVVLTVASRLVYSLVGLTVAEVTAVYMYSWLTIPIAMLAGYAFVQGSERFGRNLASRFRVTSARRVVKVSTALFLILLCITNLSALNYYKVGNVTGLGILQAHYAPKVMTDDEYYALDYIKSNTARNSIVLVVGVDQQIAIYEATVAERTIVSIRNVTVVGNELIFDGQTVSPTLQSLNLTHAEMRLNIQSEQQIYLIIGIKRVNVDMAGYNGPPPVSTTLMENAVIRAVTNSSQYSSLYQNHQVTVIELSSAHIDLSSAFIAVQNAALLGMSYDILFLNDPRVPIIVDTT